MYQELNEELEWSLRALAQQAEIQCQLYPSFVLVADELVDDFDQAFDPLSPEFKAQNPDISALDQLILSKSGQLEFWTPEALERSEFWCDIRRLAGNILKARNLSTKAPGQSPAIYVSEAGVWKNGVDDPSTAFGKIKRGARLVCKKIANLV